MWNQGPVVAPKDLLESQCLSRVHVGFFSGNNRTAAPMTLPIEEVLQTLRDLIAYFQPPEEEMQHEDKQNKLRSLKNRQNLFKEEVCPKKLNVKILFVSKAKVSLGPHYLVSMLAHVYERDTEHRKRGHWEGRLHGQLTFPVHHPGLCCSGHGNNVHWHIQARLDFKMSVHMCIQSLFFSKSQPLDHGSGCSSSILEVRIV